MSNLRELMLEKVKSGYWIDYVCPKKKEERSKEAYEQWLRSLNDEDFLEAYDRVQDLLNNLERN